MMNMKTIIIIAVALLGTMFAQDKLTDIEELVISKEFNAVKKGTDKKANMKIAYKLELESVVDDTIGFFTAYMFLKKGKYNYKVMLKTPVEIWSSEMDEDYNFPNKDYELNIIYNLIHTIWLEDKASVWMISEDGSHFLFNDKPYEITGIKKQSHYKIKKGEL